MHITTGTRVAQICLFLLTESRHLPANYCKRDQKSCRLRARAARQIWHHRSRSLAIRSACGAFCRQRLAGMTSSPMASQQKIQLRQKIQRIEQVAQASAAPILLTGPTGAGKTRLARRIFRLKKSKHLIEGNFIEVNCATLRGDAAMSTLDIARRLPEPRQIAKACCTPPTTVCYFSTKSVSLALMNKPCFCVLSKTKPFVQSAIRDARIRFSIGRWYEPRLNQHVTEGTFRDS